MLLLDLLPIKSVTPNWMRVVITVSLILIWNLLLRGQTRFLCNTEACVPSCAVALLSWIRKCLFSYRKCDTCSLWWTTELLCADKRLQAMHFVPSGSVWVPLPISCSSSLWQTEPGELAWSEEGIELLWDPRWAWVPLLCGSMPGLDKLRTVSQCSLHIPGPCGGPQMFRAKPSLMLVGCSYFVWLDYKFMKQNVYVSIRFYDCLLLSQMLLLFDKEKDE